MSNLSQFVSGGGGKLRYQEFSASGTFTPSATLLANGGQCFVELVGGGGGSGSTNHSAGNGGSYVASVVTVSGATTVTIGAGGAAGATGAAGGDTSFGAFCTAKGGVATVNVTTQLSGMNGHGAATPAFAAINTSGTPGGIFSGRGVNGRGGGGQGNASGASSPVDGGGASGVAGAANTGGGGGWGAAGGSGWCRVTWFE